MSGVLVLMMNSKTFSGTAHTYTSGSGATETAPSGASQVTIEVWGGGGGGGAGVGVAAYREEGQQERPEASDEGGVRWRKLVYPIQLSRRE